MLRGTALQPYILRPPASYPQYGGEPMSQRGMEVLRDPGHVVAPERSALMARIRSSNTTPEWRVRSYLHTSGLRYRLHVRKLPGTPDLVFPMLRLAVFVHGCFWHRHTGCKATRTPKSCVAYWKARFAANVERDKRVRKRLRELGWNVIVVWECQTKREHALQRLVRRIIARKAKLQSD